MMMMMIRVLLKRYLREVNIENGTTFISWIDAGHFVELSGPDWCSGTTFSVHGKC